MTWVAAAVWWCVAAAVVALILGRIHGRSREAHARSLSTEIDRLRHSME